MRIYNRFDTENEIPCRIEGEQDYVTLYNISSGGCMIESTSHLAAVGAHIVVQLNDITEIPGVIVWKHSKNMGIKFDAVIMQSALQNMGYGTCAEEFDEYDQRDRFGIPLVAQMGHRAHGLAQPEFIEAADFQLAPELSIEEAEEPEHDEMAEMAELRGTLIETANDTNSGAPQAIKRYLF